MRNGAFIDNQLVGERITAVRKRLDLTQKDLTRELGFANRQTLQTIENGTRRLKADELVRLVEITGYPIEFFTDPLLWTGNGTFSYRGSIQDPETLDRFEEVAGSWVNLWRCCTGHFEGPKKPIPEFIMDEKSSFEDAQEVADSIRRWLSLGDKPASVLPSKIEFELGIPVIYVSIPGEISGATYCCDDGKFLFVNKDDSYGRRNYDLAHELFHVFTWSHQQPERIDRGEDPDPALNKRQRRFEQLAENFASALLMPADSIGRSWETIRPILDVEEKAIALRKCSLEFAVSGNALLWRLVNLGLMQKTDVQVYQRMLCIIDERDPIVRPVSLPLSRLYLERVSAAISNGVVSVRRVAGLLQIEIDELSDAFTVHGLEVPFDI